MLSPSVAIFCLGVSAGGDYFDNTFLCVHLHGVIGSSGRCGFRFYRAISSTSPGGNVRVYFPIVTSIVLSVVLTLIIASR